MSRLSNWGMRRTMDVASKFYEAGLPVYLRVKLDTQVQDTAYVQFGFQVAASGNTVTQDLLLDPPPQVEEVSLHDIGLNTAQLQFGSRHFYISHTWVKARQEEMSYQDAAGQPDFYRVFQDKSVVGLYYNSRLFTLNSITHEDLAGAPWLWHIVASSALYPVSK